ncbi:MAG: hypothetical protein K2F86_08060, partial [Duncaniella sp.]|nr:hypothetical protein [Duncaniella sp.]
MLSFGQNLYRFFVKKLIPAGIPGEFYNARTYNKAGVPYVIFGVHVCCEDSTRKKPILKSSKDNLLEMNIKALL